MDFTKTCWYCHGETMLPKGSYDQCANCGATWNETYELNPSPFAEEKEPYTGFIGYRPRKRRVVGVGKKIRRK